MSYPSPKPTESSVESGNAWRHLGLGVMVLALCFAGVWMEWFRLSQAHEIHSYLPLIPFLSGYLGWTHRSSLQIRPLGLGLHWRNHRMACVTWFGLAVVLLFSAAALSSRTSLDPTLTLDLRVLAFCAAAYGVATLTLGLNGLRQLAFPAAFLLFLIPLPDYAIGLMETFFQHTSAEVADVLIRMAGIPILRDGLVFQLPNITLQVAPQCSGIRSSWMLFLTAVLGSRMLLDRPLHRWLLILFVIPLGIVRNGVRILVLAWLCVELDPAYIDSAIHHHGGPLFFGLSLIPFTLFVWFLRKKETGRTRPEPEVESLEAGLSAGQKKASSH